MNTKRAVSSLIAAGIIALAISGCTSSPETVSIKNTQAEVSLHLGDTLEVDFGEVNATTGAGWVASKEPSSNILTSGEEHSEYLGEEGVKGDTSKLTYVFKAKEKGKTTVDFEYRFQGEVPENAEDQKFSSISITVK